MKHINTTFFTLLLSSSVSAQSPCLIANYPFDGNANDVTGNGHDGIVSGATLATDRFGNDSSCYQFDGINDFIELAGAFSSATGTASAWVYIADFADLRPVFAQRDPGYDGIATSIAINADGLQDTKRFYKETDRRDCPGGSGQLYFTNGDPILEDSTWMNLIASSDGSIVHLYINCTEVATYPSTGGSDDPGFWFADMCMNPSTWIGAEKRLSDEWYFKGRIDDVRVYDCALSAEEIAGLCDIGTVITSRGQQPAMHSYPNPTTGSITIEGITADLRSTPIQLLDLQGRVITIAPTKITSTGRVMLDLTGLPDGPYVLRIGEQVHPIIKQD